MLLLLAYLLESSGGNGIVHNSNENSIFYEREE